MHEEDPDQAAQLKYLIDNVRREVDQAKQVRQRELQEQQKQQEQKYQEYIDAQKTVLLQRIPDVADPKKAEAVFKRVNEALSSHGFSADEINNATDARAIEMAYKAALWDEAQSKRKQATEKVTKAPKYQKSGGAGGKVAKGAIKSQAYNDAYKKARDAGGSKQSVEALILQKFKE